MNFIEQKMKEFDGRFSFEYNPDGGFYLLSDVNEYYDAPVDDIKMKDFIRTALLQQQEEIIKDVYGTACIFSDGSHSLIGNYIKRKYPEIKLELFDFSDTNQPG